MARPADIVVLVVCSALVAGLVGYGTGYDKARSECKSIKKEVPFKDMTYKQQVKWSKWMNREREVIR